ncbi:MAG: hypothetical protein Q7U68_01480, partial [Candidatus Roizmanbacteria bacterium]|nr:hypothetical protein [Candidatus Roizmanbacteria bacterium]
MAKVAILNIPGPVRPALGRVLAFFDNLIYPVWAFRNFHFSRQAKYQLRRKTYLPKVKESWVALTDQQRKDWKTAGNFIKLNGWLLFTQDYSFRKKQGFDLPGIPSTFHEVYGLVISNLGGLELVETDYYTSNISGPITVSFSYFKNEYTSATGLGFGVEITAYYFEGGENKAENLVWIANLGNLPWLSFSQSIGVAGREYYLLKVAFFLDEYNADVGLDHFLIADTIGDIYREGFKKTRLLRWDG